jgi:hypothetical protein
MYEPEAQDSIHVVLNEQLERDASGELRDRLTDELQVAATEIKEALGGGPALADAAVLKGLLEAVGLCEQAVVDVWKAFHC